jgi:hypothetical protein
MKIHLAGLRLVPNSKMIDHGTLGRQPDKPQPVARMLVDRSDRGRRGRLSASIMAL